ncbi:hypothetical protein LUD75_07100 [Epilithonimonas sp. JDS]|uniref:hypothetical protein n=1 Tax=Epilithonimonas sp. JDS TaxID=2902797 RepID=UPI001E4AE4A8|nr:hypothetical protein [Epilithonimonas sp. JDS]MCD9854466.1 hypothetical protein [Epilithonimonas sp. JDS]
MKILKLISFLILILSLPACNRENNEPETINTNVSAEDLLGHQMYWALQFDGGGDPYLRFMYFEKAGNTINATIDGVNNRRIVQNVKVENNILSIDLNNNGSVMYTFELEKNNDGTVLVKSAKYYDINHPNDKLGDGAGILPLSKFSSVKGTTYKEVNGSTIIRFNADNTFLSGQHPNSTGSYYEFGIGGFKASIDNETYFGFKMTDGENIFIVLQYTGDYEIYSYQNY